MTTLFLHISVPRGAAFRTGGHRAFLAVTWISSEYQKINRKKVITTVLEKKMVGVIEFYLIHTMDYHNSFRRLNK